MTTGSTDVNLQSYPNFGYRHTKVWSGVDAIDEADRRKEHTYSAVHTFENNAHMYYQFNGDPKVYGPSTILWLWGHTGYADEVFDANDDLKLLNKAAKKTRGSDFNLGNFIGEANQTVRLISDTAFRVAKMLHYIRDGNFYAAAKSVGKPQIARGHVLNRKNRKPYNARHVSDAVLELQYGWRPLLSDVHGAAETLAQKLEVPFSTTVRVARKKINEDELADSYGPVVWKRSTMTRKELRIVYKTAPTLPTILHLNDPLSVLWEVMPWSFVADWFLPIGDYLGAVDYYRNFDIASVWVSHLVVKTAEPSGIHPNNGVVYYNEPDGRTLLKEVRFDRYSQAPAVYDIPAPVFKSMKQALQPEHLLNAFALLTSTTDGFRKSLKF